ncbi:OmpA family protein [Pedobacter sp. MR2016-24]|uniref:OmpA family protein n=1 Tax=Pedobacter sp. MR2016-24 TaxID=2994466 RepID=UPI0022477A0E|nr:OmpA family protein [Pedobacter sp. MR2016-24]MCX2483764.1 OmpA family protein [Pedobacter sp. MR2016-24]
MAFDLNKNDGSAKETSNKTPGNSKFDLTKGEAAGTTVPANSSGSKNWIVALTGILIIGGGIWYYSTRSAKVSESGGAPQELAVKDTSSTIAEAQAKLGAGIASTKPRPESPSATTEPKIATSVTESAETAPAQPEAVSSNAAAVIKRLNNKIPATFAQGSASFSRIDQSLIKQITSYLSKNPASSIQVNGYASSDGSLAINQTISQARADAFKQYLVSKSIAQNRVVATGKGIENPIALNDTNAGRKKNRRVEITFP